MLMFISFPVIADEWVELGSLQGHLVLHIYFMCVNIFPL